MTPLAETTLDWEGEAEMQRLLDMLPDVQPDSKTTDVTVDSGDYPSTLDLELCGWDMSAGLHPPPVLASIGAF